MIYEYEVIYDAGGNVNGYSYTIPTGLTSSVTFDLKADGTSDDKADLQGLLDEINNQGGGTLLLPSGREILIQSGLTVYSNMTITALNKTTLKYGNNIGSRVLSSRIEYGPTVYYPLKNFTLSNITIDGTGTPGIVLFEARTTELDIDENIVVNKNIKISNCDFVGKSSTNFGIYINDVDGLIVENCTFNSSETMIRVEENSSSNANVAISDCTFTGDSSANACIQTGEINNLSVKNCSFSNANLGINLSKNAKDVYIKNNVFEASLSNNPIRVTGSNEFEEYTDGLWIIGNDIRIQRASSYILDNEIERYTDGRAIWSQADLTVIPKPIGISAINVTCAPQVDSNGDIVKDSIHHQNVVIADNIAVGPDYGFFDGGTGDLYSLKDIIRLKCYGNTSRNSGDLGYAIERCHFGVVANNTADRNNSCGISIFDSTHINVTGNICSNNELTRDGIYSTNPYGGIRVEGTSYGVFVDSNYFYTDSNVVRSYSNILYDDGLSYNAPTAPTQQYGVVVKHSGKSEDDFTYHKVPFNVKVGTNHVSGMLWGPTFNGLKSTQILDTYTKHTPPTTGDYPLGTRLRNNQVSSSTLSTQEWYVSQRIQMRLTLTASSNVIKVETVNTAINDEQGNDITFKVLENNDLTTIQKDDVIGILMDNFNIHWTLVDSIVNDEITLVDPLPTTATVASGEINKTVVSLRWEAL